MLSTLYRSLLACAWLALAFTTVHAQTLPDRSLPDAVALPSCGTARMMAGFDRERAIRNTAERTPELYREALAEAKEGRTRIMSAEEESFWAPDYVAMAFVRVKAVRVHVGELARVWIDVRDTGRVELKAKLAMLIAALEESTGPESRKPELGIIENDVEVFGPTPTTVGDGLQDFLLFDISDQSILGFFLPGDQSTDEFSNRRNLLYIDSREGMSRTTSVLNTLAHEFQHLIHFGLKPDSDLFINEGCSEVAGLMCGYPDRANASYLRATNTNMFEWPDDPTGANAAYERALTVIHYLYEQYGDGFLHALPLVQGWGMNAINAALASVNPSVSWKTAARGFAVANWLQTNSDPRYGYRVRLTSSTQRQARPLRTYSATSYRMLDTVTLQPYGIAYVVYDNMPGQLTMKFEGRYQYRTMALGFSGDNVEVLDFEPGETFTIGAGFPYDRVVLILIELSNATQKLTWAVNEAISGVEGEATAATTRFESIAPNPGYDRSTVTFTTAEAASVRLELFSPTGELVRTAIAGERLEAGTHRRSFDISGLPAGAYIARLDDGRSVATHLVVVR